MKPKTRSISFILLVVLGLGLALAVWSKAGLALGPATAQDSTPPPSAAKPHRDHTPKHGGMFFMARNNIHHLEGTLVSPATFRLYIYDAYTHPVDTAKLKEAGGQVQWGDSAGAPQTPLTLGKDGQTLEAALDKAPTFPITLILTLNLPDSRPGAKPETFKLPFKNYTEPASPAAGGRH